MLTTRKPAWSAAREKAPFPANISTNKGVELLCETSMPTSASILDELLCETSMSTSASGESQSVWVHK
jgi:hypothetical protein